jgi:hypothetical protein
LNAKPQHKTATSRAVRILALVWLTAGCSARTGPLPKQPMIQEKFLTTWLAMLDRVGPNQYKPVRNFEMLPAGVRGQSTDWCGMFFRRPANPYEQQDPVELAFHLATEDSIDLLRHSFVSGGYRLTIFESSSFAAIRVQQQGTDLMRFSNSERAAAIQATADFILVPPERAGRWVFEFPKEITEGAIFSSAPEIDPVSMAAWQDRVDGTVRNGQLVLLIYKRRPEKPAFPPARRWFDEEFRKIQGGKSFAF